MNGECTIALCVCYFVCKNMSVKQYLAHDDLILLFPLLPAGRTEYGVLYCVYIYKSVVLEKILYFNFVAA